MNFHSDTEIIFFGMSYLNNIQKKMVLAQYGLSAYPFCKTVGTEGGIEIQEYLNHHKADSICIVSDQEDIRPLEYYRIRSESFFLLYRIRKILSQPYSNKMAKQNRHSKRKQF